MTGKVFLKSASIDLSSNLSLKYGGNVNYYKIVHHPIPTLPVRIGNTPAIFKTNKVGSPFNLVSRYILCLVKLKGREKRFSEGARRGSHCEITLKSTLLS